ncbi:NAD kinase [Helcobacillus massiliensis]|uniref:NAD kinase n=1 Tax=Helcobacillus massiliensis TaxID=521392 RepID=A0A839R1T8_9MICO|nr:NAD kinase [Helcobacillus massiliensis]MBB3022596.1 NAD+ kinase [Helcobacillus massiliensis]MCT1557230.1 NAD kinase [Helcobacillus massiliensis]MCT2036920.1 NAD kinase [Helcobacillus massiliensis]MCT2332690.1 NAD kinase [Helcobacillus massiliensis]MDK7742869.1 NAD kinase [Helcobacillus massiliensis]
MMRRFLLYLHTGRSSALRGLAQVIHEMRNRGVRTGILDQQLTEMREADPALLPDGLLEAIDGPDVDIVHDLDPAIDELVIVLGGDGTILRALEIAREHSVPVHGVNLGHVGFLAESEAADLATTVHRLLDGDYSIEKRGTLNIEVYDAEDRMVAAEWALNEASLEKSDRQKMVHVVIEIDGRPVSTFGCDGVILSTSTGSTAYGFSAGGPVVWPEVDAFLVVPLAAHALFARPLVLGRSSEAAIEITADNTCSAVLTMDGRRVLDVHAGMRIESVLSPNSIQFARLTHTPFADRLVEKFELPVDGWRGRGHDDPAAQER